MNSRKKSKITPEFGQHSYPRKRDAIQGPIVDFIALLEDAPPAMRSGHLLKLARRYAASEGVYSIVKTNPDSDSFTHVYISIGRAMCELATPATLMQWSAIAFNEVIDRCNQDNVRPALNMVSDATEAFQVDLGLGLLEQVCAWNALQPRPTRGTAMLRTDQGEACVLGLVARAANASQRQQLLDIINAYVKGPAESGYMERRLSDLVLGLGNPIKGYDDDFVASAFQNITSLEFAPYVDMGDLALVAMNRLNPEVLSYALQSTAAKDALVENMEAIVAAIDKFDWGAPIGPDTTDDLEKFRQVLVMLIDHMPSEFTGLIRHYMDSPGPSQSRKSPHLVSLIQNVLLDHAVPSPSTPSSPGPRL